MYFCTLRGQWIPLTAVIDSWESTCSCCELNSWPLEQQPLLLTVEAFLQLLTSYILRPAIHFISIFSLFFDVDTTSTRNTHSAPPHIYEVELLYNGSVQYNISSMIISYQIQPFQIRNEKQLLELLANDSHKLPKHCKLLPMLLVILHNFMAKLYWWRYHIPESYNVETSRW